MEISPAPTRAEKGVAVISVICAIECVGRPVTLVLLPFLGLHTNDSELLEIFALGAVFVLGFGNILFGIFKGKRDLISAAIFSLGFITLAGNHFVFGEDSTGGIIVAATGATLIAVSQFMSSRGALGKILKK